MSDYPPRVEKSENIYKLWETGEGDMGELAIGLYDLTAHYKALWDDYAQLEAIKDEYIELLKAMKIRDTRLDEVWMMQYAEEKLKALGGDDE